MEGFRSGYTWDLLPYPSKAPPPPPPPPPLTRYVKSRVAHALGMPRTFFPAVEFKGNRELAIPACISARAWRTCRDACRDCLSAMAGKTFPAFPAHAHPHRYCLKRFSDMTFSKNNGSDGLNLKTMEMAEGDHLEFWHSDLSKCTNDARNGLYVQSLIGKVILYRFPGLFFWS